MGNSVIYRPAYDAEVEYLESTGTQWIDANYASTSSSIIEVDIQVTNITKQARIIGNASWYLEIYIADDLCIGFAFNNTIIHSEIKIDTLRHQLKIDNQNAKAYIDGTSFDIQQTTTYNSVGILSNGKATASNTNARLYGAKIWDNNILIRDFIPVRIGQVGYLYDKVSKQLFANKGTGNFILGNDVSNAVIPQQRCVLYFGNQRSVGFERIYEEYEWLCGDGYASIYLGECSNSAEFEVNLVTPTSDYGFVFGHNGVLRTHRNYSYFACVTPGSRTSIVPIPVNNLHVSIDYTTHSIYANESLIGYTNKYEDVGVNEQAYKQAYFFGSSIHPYFNSNGSLGKVKIDDNNFVPCKLLQSIPAILDGNGIARQAGECGMWDKVSGRFYGNVSESGTFTVKGPKCYEEYDTLKTLAENTSSAPYGVAYFRFPNNIQLSGKVLTLKLGNTYRDYNVFGNTVDNASYIILIYRLGSITTIQERLGRTVLNSVSNSSSTIVEIDFDNNVVSVGTSTMNIQGTGYYTLGESNVSWGTEKYLKGLTISDVLNLVPCKLTHGIPASMDANGIARPAGTCGMWDKVNDKFYGNVANSGTFTVSND